MEYIKVEKTFTVNLVEAEVELIASLTQNCNPEESQEIKDTYLNLFVGMSRLLGKNIDDNGVWLPSIK